MIWRAAAKNTLSQRKVDQAKPARPARGRAFSYPFTAIVGQNELKLALLLNAVEPRIGGVLAWGHRGTGKSTAVRALAELLPQLVRVAGCPFNCDPEDAADLCPECSARFDTGFKLRRERAPVPVIELPLNATEDRVCGTLGLERALREGTLSFEPGLLARAHRGFLYIDEVNLLEDHLVDLLLDAAASGRNRVEREGVAADHAARFALVGSANPEEGELRPQLLDRFGLCAEICTSLDPDERAEIVTRREAFDRRPETFRAAAEVEQMRLRRRLTRARRIAADVSVPAPLVRRIAELCLRLGVEGHRGELTVTRAARALAALEGRRVASAADVRRVAALALRHRLRQDPLGTTDGSSRVEQSADELFDDSNEAVNNRAQSSSPVDRRGGNQAAEASTDRNDGASQETSENNSLEKKSAQRGRETNAPTADGSTSFETIEAALRSGSKVSPFAMGGRGAARRRVNDVRRGRYVNSGPQGEQVSGRLALDATIRAAAARPAAKEAEATKTAVRIEAKDLRFKRLSRKTGTLYILAVDASGSMAFNRIRQAKGALVKLLRKSYVERDRVALVSFRGRGAELLLRPSASAALAKSRLEALPVGGPTPLAAALLRSLEVAKLAARQGAKRIVLLVFTDGRANVMLDGEAQRAGAKLAGKIRDEIERLGASLRRAGITAAVVDTRARFDTGQGRALADAMGATYTRLEVTP